MTISGDLIQIRFRDILLLVFLLDLVENNFQFRVTSFHENWLTWDNTFDFYGSWCGG